MKKIILYLMIACATLAVFLGCEKSDVLPYGLQLKNKDMPFDLGLHMWLYDAKMYGVRGEYYDDVFELCYYDLRTGEYINLGWIENYFMATYSIAYIDGYVYRMILYFSSEEGTNSDTFRIGLDDNSFEVVEKNMLGSESFYVKEMEGNLLQSVQKGNENNQLICNVEFFDVETGENTLLISKFCGYPSSGGYIYSFDYDDESEKIYILFVNYDKGGKMFLEIYSKDGTLEQEIDASVFDDGMTTRYIELTVYEDYVYMQNGSRKGAIARLEDGELKPVLPLDSGIQLVSCVRGSEEGDRGVAVFSSFSSSELIFFDYNKGILKYLDMEDAYGIYDMGIPFRNGDELYLLGSDKLMKEGDRENGAFFGTYLNIKDLLKMDLKTLPKDENGVFDLSEIAWKKDSEWKIAS